MADPPRHFKDDIAAAIHEAQADLEHALAHLARLPAFDPMAVGLATHALTNYLTVMHAGVHLLRESAGTGGHLRGEPAGLRRPLDARGRARRYAAPQCMPGVSEDAACPACSGSDSP